MKFIQVALIVLIVLLVGRWYFESRFPYTHDGENHLARFANYKIALKEGQLPPRFAPNLFNHYGYPVFNYNYPLANIISLPFSAASISYELTFKLIALGSVIAGAVGLSLLLAILQIRGRLTWLFTAFCWIANPFTISLLYIRGSIGEIMAYSLLPWLAWSIELMLQSAARSQKMPLSKKIAVLAIWSAFFLSHNSTVLFGTPFLMTLTVGRAMQLRLRFRHMDEMAILPAVAAFTSLWFWLPAWFERTAVVVTTAQNQSAWQDHFVSLQQLLFAPTAFGFSYPGTIDSLGLGIGTALPLSMLLLMSWLGHRILFARADVWKLPGIVYLALTFTALVLQLGMARELWQAVPLMRFVQFPWRLSIVVLSIGSICIGWALSLLSRRVKLFFVVLVLLSALPMLQFKPVDFFHKQTIDYDLFSQSTSTQNENRTTQFTYEQTADWQPKATALTGSADITTTAWTGSARSYELVVHETSTITEPTMVFPGWQTWLTRAGESQVIRARYIDSSQIAGRLAYSVQPGTYHVVSHFTQQTPARLIGNSISLLTLAGIALYTVHSWLSQNRSERKKSG